MGFELFVAKRSRGYDPKIAIRKNGQIYFNVGSIKHFSLTNYEHVQLLYDAEEKKIAVKLTNDKTANGILKLSRRKDESAWISAKNFFSFFQIPLPEQNKIHPKFEKNGDLIVIHYPR